MQDRPLHGDIIPREIHEEQILFEDPPVSTPLFEINPDHIQLVQVGIETIRSFQKRMSKAIWDWAVVTRQIGFQVRHHPTPIQTHRDGELLGIFFLTSPVVNLGPRDKFLNMPKDPSERGTELRHYAELSVCVAAQPIGWYWNLGKLMALVATTCGDVWLGKYGDVLKGVTTFSLWGKGTQYNRVFRYLGATKGHGHSHITPDEYQTMRRWLKSHGISEAKKSPTNKKMHIIDLYARSSGDKRFGTFHGQIRGCWYHPAQSPEERRAVIQKWYHRWGLPRYLKTKDQAPPYTDGLGTDPQKGL